MLSCIVLATANPGKVRELRGLLERSGVAAVRGLDERPGVVLPEENGADYAENAVVKARAVALATGEVALADDSGIEVVALGGAPGVRSARYATDDAARIAKLLAALRGTTDRSARFVCVVALAWPDGRVVTAEGTVSGYVAEAPRGVGGFGYDPIFVADELGYSFAEATAAVKDRVSHRARAVRALFATLASSCAPRRG